MNNKNNLCLLLDDPRWQQTLPEVDVWAHKVFTTALGYLDSHHLDAGFGFSRPIDINLKLSNNAEVQVLNRDFRGLDKPTNVLSFANIDDDFFWDELELAAEVELGDIIIALETLQSESELRRLPLKNHFAHLLVHGILHLFGYDHQDDASADEMEQLEINILQQLNIDNPYKE